MYLLRDTVDFHYEHLKDSLDIVLREFDLTGNSFFDLNYNPDVEFQVFEGVVSKSLGNSESKNCVVLRRSIGMQKYFGHGIEIKRYMRCVSQLGLLLL